MPCKFIEWVPGYSKGCWRSLPQGFKNFRSIKAMPVMGYCSTCLRQAHHFFSITTYNTHKSDSQKLLYEMLHPNIKPNSSAYFAYFKSFFHEIHGRFRNLIPAYSETLFDRIGSRPIYSYGYINTN